MFPTISEILTKRKKKKKKKAAHVASNYDELNLDSCNMADEAREEL